MIRRRVRRPGMVIITCIVNVTESVHSEERKPNVVATVSEREEKQTAAMLPREQRSNQTQQIIPLFLKEGEENTINNANTTMMHHQRWEVSVVRNKKNNTNAEESVEKTQPSPLNVTSAHNVQYAREKMHQKERQSLTEQCTDVYSKDFVPKKYAKNSPEYGRPPPGSLTEMRAKKASRHIAREILQLCEVIEEYGHRMRRSGNGRVVITFGDLFNVYQFISDKVVGMLLRARKHGMVDFEGEMLYQRRDDNKIITLLLSHDQIEQALQEFSH